MVSIGISVSYPTNIPKIKGNRLEVIIRHMEAAVIALSVGVIPLLELIMIPKTLK